MKWQVLLLLLALAAVTFAMKSERGIEFVDSAAELPSQGAKLEKGYSFVHHAPEVKAQAEAKADVAASLVELPVLKIAQPPADMDPFAAKHYKLGFYGGRFGRPDLSVVRKVPKTFKVAKLVEDCMACRFVWKAVEMDVGNSEVQKTVYDSFINNCRQGMGAPILYTPCQTMFSTVDDMITGYTSGLTVDEVCVQAKMCRG